MKAGTKSRNWKAVFPYYPKALTMIPDKEVYCSMN
jgi:hypothetical protein